MNENLQNQSLFKKVFENSAIGMALVSPDGKWLDINLSVSKILGYSKEELKKISFQEITHKEDLKKDLDYVQQMLDNKIKNYQMEKRYIHKDGHTIWALLNVSLVRNDDGKPKFFISEIIDISKIKSYANKLEEKINQLEKTNKVMVDRELRMAELKKKNC